MSLRLVRGFALVALAAGLPLAASAQNTPPQNLNNPPGQGAGQSAPHHRGGPYMRALRSLNLSDAQQTQIRSIMQSYRQKAQNADPATRRANAEQMRSNIMNVLTPAQRAQFQQELQQYRAQHEGQQPGQNR